MGGAESRGTCYMPPCTTAGANNHPVSLYLTMLQIGKLRPAKWPRCEPGISDDKATGILMSELHSLSLSLFQGASVDGFKPGPILAWSCGVPTEHDEPSVCIRRAQWVLGSASVHGAIELSRDPLQHELLPVKFGTAI